MTALQPPTIAMRILITAGPTREHLDPVRFLSNPSTGKMGFAVARAALARGHAVSLVTGPVTLPTPRGARRCDVVSALEMLEMTQWLLPDHDALVMTAAVSDWRPTHFKAAKVKKSEAPLAIELTPNPDILKTLRPLKGHRLFVGFAAETGDPVPEARRKLANKGLDLIVANDISRPGVGFGADTNRVSLIAADEPLNPLPLLSKLDVGHEILAWIERRASR